ncbi:MAG TPA: iron-containing alcohol dehydrogenase [Clostridia bacterium]|nr:iron-containing alcohol dehydrogenase [Clostridia bacterium]
MENTHNFIIPKTNLAGVGALKDLPTELLNYKLSKVLIVTDANMKRLGYVEMVETILKNLFISYEVFDGVLHPNPTVSFVEDGLTHFDKGLNILARDFSFIISIGGGTNHDCAKAIGIVAANGGSITNYEGYNKVQVPSVPLIAINTTGGSAAELTNTAIITDNTKKTKMTITSTKILPFLSVNDPMFMTTMPKEVTASSGIDVISHAIEAFVSTETSPITDSLGLGALKTAYNYLPRAYENGNDMEAREKMMFANMMAGMAFNNAGLGYAHAMGHQIGGFYEQTVHGFNMASLLPYVLDFNSVAIPDERIFKLAEAIGITAGKKSHAVEKITDAFIELCSNIGLSTGLKKMGAKEEDIPQLSENALKDICCLTNPRQGTVEEIAKMFKDAM